MAYKLAIHMVPDLLWRRNVRYALGKYYWGKLRKEILASRDKACEICGFVAQETAKIFLHEDWQYITSSPQPVARLIDQSRVLGLPCGRALGTHGANDGIRQISSRNEGTAHQALDQGQHLDRS